MFLLTLIFPAMAATTQTPNLIQTFPAEVLRNEVVEFKPVKDHHFSLEAPQNCGGGNLITRSTRALKCQFTEAGAKQATFNVCDDKKTFCKPVSVSLTVAAKAAANSERLNKNLGLNQKLRHDLVQGFVMGTPEEMKKQAAAAGKPVFAMISTDWCPPCNEAKEYLLVSPAFTNASQNWFKVYVDGDSLQAAAWERTIPYSFYPSFVFLTDKFEEVARYTGPLRQADFSAWAAEVSQWKDDPVADLKKRVFARLDGSMIQRLKDLVKSVTVEKRRREELRLLKWALDQKESATVARLIQEGKYPELEHELLAAEIAKLDEEMKEQGSDTKKDQRIELYQRLLNQLIRKDGWAGTLNDFCVYDSKACTPQQVHIEERIQFLTERPGLTEAERASMLAEEYYILGDMFQTLGKKDREKQMARECVAQYEKLGAQSKLKLSRAGRQGMIACLDSAGETARAEAELKPLIEAYPSEPTFLARMARLHRKAKKLNSALEWINKAEQVAYGYNWFSAQLIKADILLDLKRGAEAKAVLAEALGQVQIDGAQDSRNQLTVARLRAAQAKAEASLKR